MHSSKILRCIALNSESCDQAVREWLWGYPDLIKEFNENVRPTLVGAREQRRNMAEMEQ